MKKSLLWIVAILSLCASGWMFLRNSSQRDALVRQIEEQKGNISALTSRIEQERKQTKSICETHAAAQRILAQQEARLHEIYPRLIPFSLCNTNIFLHPGFKMRVEPDHGAAVISIQIENASSNAAWLLPRYRIGFLNAEGFVSGQIDSGVLGTWMQPGTNLTHEYRVTFDFGKPVYCTMPRPHR